MDWRIVAVRPCSAYSRGKGRRRKKEARLQDGLSTKVNYKIRPLCLIRLSSRAEVTVVCQTARHSELAEESRLRQQAARMNRARFLGKLGMTFFFIQLLVRDYLKPF